MTKYLSTTKLISLLPKLNLTGLYDQIKNDRPYTSFYEGEMRVFEYTYHDNESNKNYIQYVYDSGSKTLCIRFIMNQTPYNRREDMTLRPYTQWLVMVKSPELDAAHILERGYYSSDKFIIYIDLINYVLRELNATTSTLKSIIDAASIESDDPNEVFNIPDSEIECNKRLGNYLYLNGLDNGALFNRIPDIIEHIEDSNPKQIHLLNYTASLVTRLSFADLTELARLLNKANRKIQNAYSYYMPQDAKGHFRDHLTTIIAKIQERRDELMATQIQMVTLSVWKNDTKLRESIEQGANVRVVLPMSLANN